MSAPATFSSEEMRAIAAAVQWAGHFATVLGCESGGPSLTDIGAATGTIESRGTPIYHSLATRGRLERVGAPLSMEKPATTRSMERTGR